MNVLYAHDPIPKSIFLAGPTPRDKSVASWRPEAIKLIEDYGFDGNVLVPEPRGGEWSKWEYENQVLWEWEGLNTATIVLFWVPREMQTMPAFTTNVEYGMMCASGKCVLGHPIGAPKCGYLDALAQRYNIPNFYDLTATVQYAIRKAMLPFHNV
jgi:hypothetical protein